MSSLYPTGAWPKARPRAFRLLFSILPLYALRSSALASKAQAATRRRRPASLELGLSRAEIAQGSSSLRANAGLGRNIAPLLDVTTNALRERFRRTCLRRHALRNEHLRPIGGIENLVHPAVEPRDDRRRRGGRRDESNP